MKPPGLLEVERAKADGRWASAYDSPKASSAPDDLIAALSKNKRAQAFFEQLDASNRYAILHRLQTAKKPETRTRRIAQFIELLAARQTLHPPRKALARKAAPRKAVSRKAAPRKSASKAMS